MKFLYVGKRSVTCRVLIPLSDSEGPSQQYLPRNFPFKKYQHGKQGAIRAAKRWRNYHAEKLYGPGWREKLATQVSPRTKSRLNHPDAEAGVNYVKIQGAWTWRATWLEGPPHRRIQMVKTFAVGVHGYDAAYEQALAARRKGLDADQEVQARIFRRGGVTLEKDDPILCDLPSGISRYSNGTDAPGWLVKTHFRNNVPLVYRTIMDKDFDCNAEKSLNAAKSYLKSETEKLLRDGKLRSSETGELLSAKVKQKRQGNKPISGLGRYYDIGVDGDRHGFWFVSWTIREEGKSKSRKKRFTDSKYSDYAKRPACWWAFVEAFACRRDKEIDLYGKTDLPDPNDTRALKKIYDYLQENSIVLKAS